MSQNPAEPTPSPTSSPEPTPQPSSTSPETTPAEHAAPLFGPSRRSRKSPPRSTDETAAAVDAFGSEPEPLPAPEPSSAHPGSERGHKPQPFAGKAAVSEAVATGLKISTGVASERFAPPEAPEMFELTPEDEERMVPPLAGLASRRVPATMAGNPDLTDAIAGAMAFALYVGRQLETWRAVRRLRKAQAGAGEPLRQDEAAALGAPDLTGP